MTDRAEHAATRRLHRELRSPLPPEGDVGVEVDHVDDLREMWDGLVADSALVEPQVGHGDPTSRPAGPAPSAAATPPGARCDMARRHAPRRRLDASPGREPLIVLPPDEPNRPPATAPSPLSLPPLPPSARLGGLSSPSRQPRRRSPRPSRHAASAVGQAAGQGREAGTRLELRRHRILPRTVIGISTVLLAAAVGAAFSGRCCTPTTTGACRRTRIGSACWPRASSSGSLTPARPSTRPRPRPWTNCRTAPGR